MSAEGFPFSRLTQLLVSRFGLAVCGAMMISALSIAVDIPLVYAGDNCPGGSTAESALLNRRVPVRFADEPLQINPMGLCGFHIWHRNCIYVQQAGDQRRIGPFCPTEARMMPGAVRLGYGVGLPVDVEFVWSAQQPFIGYVALTTPNDMPDPERTGPGRITERDIEGSPAWLAACSERHPSFNPTTLTYTTYSGKQKRCILRPEYRLGQ